jgi:hypothetical protein
MNPDERQLLERTLKLSEENNQMLRKIRRTTRWAFVWGVIKLVILIVPFLIAYMYLEPHFGTLGNTFEKAQEIINLYK